MSDDRQPGFSLGMSLCAIWVHNWAASDTRFRPPDASAIHRNMVCRRCGAALLRTGGIDVIAPSLPPLPEVGATKGKTPAVRARLSLPWPSR